MANKHIVIFSHGFGVKKDDRGLLSDIATALENIEPRLFDYNEIDEINNTITTRPLSEQVKMLRRVIAEAREANPDAVIDLVCHSQGALVVALLQPDNIRRVVFLAPRMGVDVSHSIDMFKDRPGSVIDLNGVSRLARRDGSLTLVPAAHWQELQKINPPDLYNQLAEKTELTIIKAKQDEVLAPVSDVVLSKKIRVLDLDGSHNFTGARRAPLVAAVKEILE